MASLPCICYHEQLCVRTEQMLLLLGLGKNHGNEVVLKCFSAGELLGAGTLQHFLPGML